MMGKYIRAQARKLQRYGQFVPGATARERQRAKVALSKQALKRLFIGAGLTEQDGWVSTDKDVLNILESDDWFALCPPGSLDAITAEHVWEHLTPDEGRRAAKHCFTFLKPGGRLRLAVPDGWNPRPDYIQHVRPGGTGAGADDHKVLYNRASLEELLNEVGFVTEVLEYFDQSGNFHFTEWLPEDGYIKRSSRFDYRNRGSGALNYTSLIIDATKPRDPILRGA